MKYFSFVYLFFFIFGGSASAQDIITDLSSRAVDIRYSFSGADLLLFGTVNLPENLRKKGYDIAVIVEGPSEKINVRKKEKMAFIWVNKDVHTFQNVPGFYMVASNRPLDDIAALKDLSADGVGYQALTFEDKKHGDHVELFHNALVKNKERDGLYKHNPAGVKIIGGGLFRADFSLPANVPVGAFKVSAFVYVDGKLLMKRNMQMDVEKKGFERAIYSYAHEYPFFYGLMAAFVALLAGWVAGYRRRQ